MVQDTMLHDAMLDDTIFDTYALKYFKQLCILISNNGMLYIKSTCNGNIVINFQPQIDIQCNMYISALQHN